MRAFDGADHGLGVLIRVLDFQIDSRSAAGKVSMKHAHRRCALRIIRLVEHWIFSPRTQNETRRQHFTRREQEGRTGKLAYDDGALSIE